MHTKLNTEPDAGPRPRLEYLEGLRGCAALYVVFFHCWLIIRDFVRPQPQVVKALAIFSFGRSAVAVFIVLSGYVLMLPVLRTAERRLRGGWQEYLKRRARRILPPYYAAVLVSLAVLAVLPKHLSGSSLSGSGLWFGYSLPAFTPGILLSHLFLVHNLRAGWIYAIDVPLWSVATEWQIYFLFPLLLLPLLRRFGLAAAVAGAFAVGLGLHFAAPRFDAAAPWFLGLFALGMAGAALSGPSRPGRTGPVRWGLWAGFFAAISAAAHLRLLYHHRDIGAWESSFPSDILVGLATACFLVHCAKSATVFWGLRGFQSRPAAALGGFSYSLYLVHSTALGAAQCVLLLLHLSPAWAAAALLLLGLPLSVGASYLFYLAFERPFLSSRPAAVKAV